MTSDRIFPESARRSRVEDAGAVLGGDVLGGIAGAGVHDDDLIHEALHGGEAGGQFATIEELKARGCPGCGAHSFQLISRRHIGANGSDAQG